MQHKRMLTPADNGNTNIYWITTAGSSVFPVTGGELWKNLQSLFFKLFHVRNYSCFLTISALLSHYRNNFRNLIFVEHAFHRIRINPVRKQKNAVLPSMREFK